MPNEGTHFTLIVAQLTDLEHFPLPSLASTAVAIDIDFVRTKFNVSRLGDLASNWLMGGITSLTKISDLQAAASQFTLVASSPYLLFVERKKDTSVSEFNEAFVTELLRYDFLPDDFVLTQVQSLSQELCSWH